MKRSLLTAPIPYLLYDRQKRVEARVKAWQHRRDAELRQWNEAVNADLQRFAGEVNDELAKVVEAVSRAFKGIARGEKR